MSREWLNCLDTDVVMGSVLVDPGFLVEAAVFLTHQGSCYGVMPPQEDQTPWDAVDSFGAPLDVEGEEGSAVQVVFVTFPADRFNDTDEPEFPFAVRPSLKSVVDSAPQDFKDAIVAAIAPLPDAAPKRRGAGRGRGSAQLPTHPEGLPAAGRGRGRLTVASLSEQVSGLVESIHGLTAVVQQQGEQLQVLQTQTSQPLHREGDLMRVPGALSPPGLGSLQAEVQRDPHVGKFTALPPAGVPRCGERVPPPPKSPPAPTVQPHGDQLSLALQTIAQLTATRRSRKDPLRNLLGGTGDDDEDDEDSPLRLPGARGAAAMELLAQELEGHPSRITETVTKRLRMMA
eukprot:6470010-Amphidinium_carterae.1